MKRSDNKRLMKIIIPNTNHKLTIYENGLVYGWEHESKIIKLITNKSNIKETLLCN